MNHLLLGLFLFVSTSLFASGDSGTQATPPAIPAFSERYRIIQDADAKLPSLEEWSAATETWEKVDAPEQLVPILWWYIMQLDEQVQTQEASLKALSEDVKQLKLHLNTMIDMLLSQEYHDDMMDKRKK